MQSVTHLIADPGVASLISAQSHTFMEIDHELISTVFLLLPLNLEGLLSVTSKRICMKYWLYRLAMLAKEKVWLGDMTVLT